MDNISQLKDGEMFLAVPAFRLKGKAQAVFQMLNILANTYEAGDDVYWWSIRAQVLAVDKDRQHIPDLKERMN